MVAVQKEQRKSTAAQVILLAADDLAAAGTKEFTEWELTVAAWQRDPARFGLRGYEQKYPDHKRVMSEIMGSKPSNPVQLRHLEKVRPSTYRLTALGRSEAARLRSGASEKTSREKDPHTTLSAYIGHRAFARWRNDPEQPRLWSDVADFLAAGPGAPDDVAAQLDFVRRAIRAGLDYCQAKDLVKLEPRSRSGGAPIHVRDIAELSDFLLALQYRFPDEMEGRTGSAIRRK
jgi:hypothetical protein